MVELLAKPDTGLLDHLVEVTQLGAEIAPRLGLSRELRTKALLTCALHDIGKAIQDLQDYIQGRRKKAYPHALASLPFVLVAEGLLNRHLRLKQTRYKATAAVLSHHSPLSPQLYKGYEKATYHQELEAVLRGLWTLLSDYGIEALPPVDVVWQGTQFFLQRSPAVLLEEKFQGADKEIFTLRGPSSACLGKTPPASKPCCLG